MSTENQPPAEQDAKWFFESEEEKELGIDTAIYPNGQKVKRCTLADGRVAVVRRLKGKDAKTVSRFSNGEEERYHLAIMTVSTVIHGQKVTPEELEELWMDDFNKLQAMSVVNFPTAQKA